MLEAEKNKIEAMGKEGRTKAMRMRKWATRRLMHLMSAYCYCCLWYFQFLHFCSLLKRCCCGFWRCTWAVDFSIISILISCLRAYACAEYAAFGGEIIYLYKKFQIKRLYPHQVLNAFFIPKCSLWRISFYLLPKTKKKTKFNSCSATNKFSKSRLTIWH